VSKLRRGDKKVDRPTKKAAQFAPRGFFEWQLDQRS
jgi:hypothetical protein